VLKIVEEKYCLKLPKRVIAIDFGEDIRDLFVRFKLAEHTEGDASEDGKVIVHHDERGKVAPVEITDLTAL
jgi:hypothetical protein